MNKPLFRTIDDLAKVLPLKDGIHVSFHHHLRNGDTVINDILRYIHQLNLKNLHLLPSGIFPTYEAILELLKAQRVKTITTNYLNGPVATFLANEPHQVKLIMQTHGGRARAIIEGENTIDIAFIAASSCDLEGNATGLEGKNPCGALGYAIEDAQYASLKVIVTDTLVDQVKDPQIKGDLVDYIYLVDSIGDSKGIVSGTTAITNDPVGVKIAKQASKLLVELGVIKEGFSFQSGAGGVSLRVTDNIKDYLLNHQIKASFFSGGITKYHVAMLETGLVKDLYDVQCFDLEAVKSLKRNAHHHFMSASDYANPSNENRITKDLDIVILGATEIDLDFNVNVTTDSYNTIIGGSGGHSDTASDAKLTIIVTPLIKGRTPIIKNKVNTITTLGNHIDCVVTERGIAINPKRTDLIEALKNSTLPIMSIEALQEKAHHLTGVPEEKSYKDSAFGVIVDRDGTVIDTLYKKKG
jgi:citrate lyase subunit alpha/citrate CoA-transferase